MQQDQIVMNPRASKLRLGIIRLNLGRSTLIDMSGFPQSEVRHFGVGTNVTQHNGVTKGGRSRRATPQK